MAIEVRKRKGESSGGLLYRFTKKMRHSGIMLETRKRRFKKRPKNRNARRISAVYKAVKKKEVEKARKLGVL
jgi:ribosomal protein S21